MAGKALATTKKVTTPEVVDVAIEVAGIPTTQEVVAALTTGSKLYVAGDDTATSILPGILAGAEKAVDVFGGGELEKLEDHLGEKLTVLSVDGARNSDFEGGLGIYLIVSAADPNGEVIQLSVGTQDGVGKLVKLHELHAFPWTVRFERATKATKGGFYPINMVNAEPAKASDLRAGEKSF